MRELENKKWPHSLTRTQCIEDLERQLEEYKNKEQKRKGASLNELMTWSVKELAELVVDLKDEHEDPERQLDCLPSFYRSYPA